MPPRPSRSPSANAARSGPNELTTPRPVTTTSVRSIPASYSRAAAFQASAAYMDKGSGQQKLQKPAERVPGAGQPAPVPAMDGRLVVDRRVRLGRHDAAAVLAVQIAGAAAATLAYRFLQQAFDVSSPVPQPPRSLFGHW